MVGVQDYGLQPQGHFEAKTPFYRATNPKCLDNEINRPCTKILILVSRKTRDRAVVICSITYPPPDGPFPILERFFNASLWAFELDDRLVNISASPPSKVTNPKCDKGF